MTTAACSPCSPSCAAEPGLALMPRDASAETMRAMGATLLIVDDHDGFRAFARAVLEAEGFDVVGEASTGPGRDQRGRASCVPTSCCST